MNNNLISKKILFYICCFTLTVLGATFLTILYAIREVDIIELQLTFVLILGLIVVVAWTCVGAIKEIVSFK